MNPLLLLDYFLVLAGGYILLGSVYISLKLVHGFIMGIVANNNR